MNEDTPARLEYDRRRIRPAPWWFGKLVQWAIGGCLFAALYLGFMYVVTSTQRVGTPQYLAYVASVQAKAATQPAGTPVQWPTFTGPRYTIVTTPILRSPLMRMAIGFAGGAVALIVIDVRLRRG